MNAAEARKASKLGAETKRSREAAVARAKDLERKKEEDAQLERVATYLREIRKNICEDAAEGNDHSTTTFEFKLLWPTRTEIKKILEKDDYGVTISDRQYTVNMGDTAAPCNIDIYETKVDVSWRVKSE